MDSAITTKNQGRVWFSLWWESNLESYICIFEWLQTLLRDSWSQEG